MDTCLECLVLADLHNAEELKDAAVKFVVDHSEEFVDQVKMEKIKQILIFFFFFFRLTSSSHIQILWRYCSKQWPVVLQ